MDRIDRMEHLDKGLAGELARVAAVPPKPPVPGDVPPPAETR
ncbi:hypothetical protein ACFYXC_05855 [Streptomyces sp. NPDC002701]